MTIITIGNTEEMKVDCMDSVGGRITGLTDVLLLIRRVSDGFYFDFNDTTFKSSGWTTQEYTMLEIDATYSPGQYRYVFDSTGMSEDELVFTATCVSAYNSPYGLSLQVRTHTWNVILTGATFNIVNSAGKILRVLKEANVYPGNSLWYDSLNGTPGSDPYENGTVGIPVDNEADLRLLIADPGKAKVTVAPGSLLTLGGAYINTVIKGESWTLALGGRDISNCTFIGQTMSGTALAATAPPSFRQCKTNACTLPPCTISSFRWSGMITAGSAGDFHFHSPKSGTAGTGAPTLDAGGFGASNFNFRLASTGIEIHNLTTGDNVSLEGFGQLILPANSTGGTIAIRGFFTITGKDAFIAAGGVISDDARYSLSNLFSAVIIGTVTVRDSFVALWALLTGQRDGFQNSAVGTGTMASHDGAKPVITYPHDQNGNSTGPIIVDTDP
jgi:hypothetical protein